jgi:aspartyl-tRNA(Asn)/glutamyl-tRNA(Gln) amidotransferase subunit A
LIATLGRDRFLQQKGLIDPVAFERASGGIDMLATDYIRMLRRHHRLIDIARERMIGLDGWITPTTPLPPLPVADFATKESAAQWNLKINVNGRPGNLFGQCGVSIPIHMFDTSLPVGLQILCPPDHDRRLLSIARGIEELLGRPPKPDVAKFL